MIVVSRPVLRVTREIHPQTGKHLVIRIDPNGRTVSIKVKGTRTWYTVTLRQIFAQGGWNKAAQIRAERKARKEQRKHEAF